MKTISILIAAWQAQDWLKDCLNGVFQQCLPEGWGMQVLLGIDGCAKTYDVIPTLDFPDLEIVWLEQNCGTYVTFNTLMPFAKGELIARFDADDVMQPGYLAAHIAAIEAGSDMTLTWSIYTDLQLHPTSHVLAHEVYHPENGLNRRGAEGQFVIRSEFMHGLGGFRPWRCGADTDFFKRVRAAGFRSSVIEQFLYLRRTHHHSLTVNPETNFKSPYRLCVQKLAKHYEQQYQSGQRRIAIKPVRAKKFVFLKAPFPASIVER
jgi:glycosyltransferase involved in cell wall biosynthesis